MPRRARAAAVTTAPARPRARRNDFTVKVGRVGDEVKEYAFDKPVSVEEVLETAGINYGDGQRLRFKGETVTLDDEINEDGTLIVSGQIKGGLN